MASRGATEVIGEDFSGVAIENARTLHASSGASFAVGDIQSISHQDGMFDLVVSCETIEHVPHPARAVHELARVLRPGGTLLLSTPNYLSLTGVYRAFSELTGRGWDEGGQPLVNWTTYPRTAMWIRRAGLAIKSTRGEGWVVPVRGRPGGLVIHPPAGLRRWLKLVARHVLFEARKPH